MKSKTFAIIFGMRTKRLHKQVVSIYIYSKNIYSNIYIKRKRKKKKKAISYSTKSPKQVRKYHSVKHQ